MGLLVGLDLSCCFLVGNSGLKLLTLELETLHLSAEFHVAEFPRPGAFSLEVGSVQETTQALRWEAELAGRSCRKCYLSAFLKIFY